MNFKTSTPYFFVFMLQVSAYKNQCIKFVYLVFGKQREEEEDQCRKTAVAYTVTQQYNNNQ